MKRPVFARPPSAPTTVPVIRAKKKGDDENAASRVNVMVAEVVVVVLMLFEIGTVARNVVPSQVPVNVPR